jgi:hypothetical protein
MFSGNGGSNEDFKSQFRDRFAEVKKQAQYVPKAAPIPVDEEAESIYKEKGDVALADYYLAQAEKPGATISGDYINAAKNVIKTQNSANPWTFAKEGEKNIQRYEGAVSNMKKNGTEKGSGGPLQNPFQFALNGSSQSSTPTQSGSSSSSSSANTSESESETAPKYSWQQSKEKAQAWQAENEKVNEWKKTFNTNTGQGGFNQQYDFSSKNFMGT